MILLLRSTQPQFLKNWGWGRWTEFIHPGASATPQEGNNSTEFAICLGLYYAIAVVLWGYFIYHADHQPINKEKQSQGPLQKKDGGFGARF